MPAQPDLMSDSQVHAITDLNPAESGVLQNKVQTSLQQKRTGSLGVPQVMNQPSVKPRYIPGLVINNVQQPISTIVPSKEQDPRLKVLSLDESLRNAERETIAQNTVPQRRESKVELEEVEFEINKILKARVDKAGNKTYLIDWKGIPASARTYEPYENLNEIAKEYVDKHEVPIEGK